MQTKLTMTMGTSFHALGAALSADIDWGRPPNLDIACRQHEYQNKCNCDDVLHIPNLELMTTLGEPV